MKVGFVGLGGMGSAMAANLQKAGHEVTVWSRRPEPAERLRELGARVVDSPNAAFKGDAFLSMLSDDAAVRAVVEEGGLLSGKTDTAHINCATVSVACAEELTTLHQKAGAPYLAAPVFGRPEAAAAAKLHVVAAGDPALIAKMQPLFDAIGQKTGLSAIGRARQMSSRSAETSCSLPRSKRYPRPPHSPTLMASRPGRCSKS
jgi:3-hydroxyisobutyrate dehydrogenase-like beta-hydroxyacid dehydrogenase